MEKFFDTNVKAEHLDSYLFTRCMDLNYNGKWSNHWDTFDSIIWKEGEIQWYLDGKLWQTQKQWSSEGGKFPAPFDQRFHLLINLAVGGNWPGPPDGKTKFPAQLLVDYVRVYQWSK